VLFDLSGKRRRVVQVVYAILALLMGGSLVLFGIGSDAPGGILDAVGLGGNDSGDSGNPQYDEQISDAESRLETDPENTTALLNLARYHYLSATSSGVTTDPETGIPEVSEGARQELESSIAAWNRYLDTKPKTPNASVANSVVQAYVLVDDAEGAAKTQEIVAAGNPSAAAFGALAFYYYADGQLEAGDSAADKAIAEAEPSERKQIQKQLDAYAEAARKQKKQLEKLPEGGATGGGAGIEDPFGGIGGGAPAPAPAP
jgi:tetratricopeptide (TPR) repeat protein